MKITNQDKAGWIKLSYYLSVLLYLASIVVISYLNRSSLVIDIALATLVFVVFLVFMLLHNFNYVIYLETNDKLVFRYYPLHPFHDNFKLIEIPKHTFKGYKMNRKYMGICKEIVLFQYTIKGIAKYPAVSISGFTKKDRQKLLGELDRLKM